MIRPIWRLYSLILVLLVMAADQYSKWYIVTRVFAREAGLPQQDLLTWLFQKAERLGSQLVEITSFFNLAMVWNPGISFGMFQTGHSVMAYVLTGTSLLVALGFYAWMWLEPYRLRAISVGLIVGGALGNVWDRLRFGAVIDFLDLHWGGWHWPAFNVADASISVGVALLLIDMIFFSHRHTSMRN